MYSFINVLIFICVYVYVFMNEYMYTYICIYVYICLQEAACEFAAHVADYRSVLQTFSRHTSEITEYRALYTDFKALCIGLLAAHIADYRGSFNRL